MIIFSHSKGMDLPPLKDEKGGVELQQVTVVTIDNDSSARKKNPELTINQDPGPPPYKEQNGIYSISNGSVPSTPTFNKTSRISPPSSPFGNNITFDGDDSGLSPRTNRSNTLSVDSAQSARRRHKSEGQLPGSPGKSMYLDPNRKSSTYESRSTISGIKFDDSYIGKYLFYSYKQILFIALKNFQEKLIYFKVHNEEEMFYF